MAHIGKSWCLIWVFVVVSALVSLPAMAQTYTPPYFGPPNMHANTKTGTVDTAGTGPGTGGLAYPAWRNGQANIYLENPWTACAGGSDDFLIEATPTTGVRTTFKHWGRSVVIDQFDGNGHAIGATYSGGTNWPNDAGTGVLVKSNPNSTYYDQVRCVGTKIVDGQIETVNVDLSLVERDSYIGINNLASVATHWDACGAANKNTQIWVPMGMVDGLTTVIPDVDGDGSPDTDAFYIGAPITGAGVAPIPTVTEWGLGALTILFLILGVHYARKRGVATPA